MSQLAAYTRKVDKRGRPGHMHAVHWYYVIISCPTLSPCISTWSECQFAYHRTFTSHSWFGHQTDLLWKWDKVEAQVDVKDTPNLPHGHMGIYKWVST